MEVSFGRREMAEFEGRSLSRLCAYLLDQARKNANQQGR